MQFSHAFLLFLTIVSIIASLYFYHEGLDARETRDRLLAEIVNNKNIIAALQTQISVINAEKDSLKIDFEEKIKQLRTPRPDAHHIIIPSNLMDLAYVNRFIPDLVPINDEFAVSQNYGEIHQGVDFATSEGKSVIASAAGVIIARYSDNVLGNVIMLDHLNSYKTLYAHMSVFKANIKEFVEKGQEIGTVGNTGNSSNPHLHFQIYYQNDPIDPNTLMRISKFNNGQKTNWN